MSKYPNSGILSRNDRRQSEKHPEFNGSAEVDGVEYWLSAWVNEKDGRKFFRLSFKRKEERQGSYMAGDDPPEQGGDVPF